MNALFLAFAYLRYHWGRSLVLVLVTALILFVPVATQTLLSTSERALVARGEATPLLLGSRGSQLDLTMAALYFSDERPDPVEMREVETIWNSGLGIPIPVHTAFASSGFRIVGTTLDYFDFRDLTIADGRGLSVLGDAVIGADVAEALGKGVGDSLVSSPENLFDLDGVYPLEMPIVGVLEQTNTPDDQAVFVDIKTAWVIQGIGHGHEDVVTAADIAAGTDALANAAVVQYQRITPDNIESFHFHGSQDDFPASAVIIVPNDTRSATILKGRYLDTEGPSQLIEPAGVIRGLVDRIFRIKALLDGVTAIIAIAAFAAIGLAVFLSYRLRAREIATAVKLGARRGMVLRLLAAETVTLLLLSGGIAAVGAVVTARNAEAWVGWMLALGA
ncbi:ABC transporter permease [Ponticoccus sp. SC2-23]|uniref:ABC transporter permease n=1 Tax=Alexandriicola marinus TaxID=2081710 RepID=UPI000FD8304F|nr:ABC transporter permease [Alexandriicola marinus]MBM1219775.1 ABC transporter permease [Ponticoccus sp. SC6-9]MBM1223153.1 ABC transporter permease [Ponticoccus sp. SC6-15]MBM1229588.1 ABC transporter permease [Ponticoccus sp. SC6-38]MBM1232119.1 ABC transporter permease [Ponticoccus sp. SC6-45]MBM1237931.1 ABC transporter permease [Ponticoccus sp. SC6-49]MBM1241130.1 ABC transporter permease [Ponticoccus sp. SC2-64]MBM1245643.1 ABC transporter permease [Ponticoccus sp. SC6-42]MBM1250121